MDPGSRSVTGQVPPSARQGTAGQETPARTVAGEDGSERDGALGPTILDGTSAPCKGWGTDTKWAGVRTLRMK